ncbi:hypothetical protein Btru_024579 [Bulinus truncatus]|nr:hypothetical protein Btru_024579 [Bulinus truncatus]
MNDSHTVNEMEVEGDYGVDKDHVESLQQENFISQDRSAIDDDIRIHGSIPTIDRAFSSFQVQTDVIIFLPSTLVKNFKDGSFSAVFKNKCSTLTPKISTSSSKGDGSGSMIHPKIWKHFDDSQNLQLLKIRPARKSCELAIKVSKELISTDNDASLVIVDLPYYDFTVRIKGCSKESFDIEGCSVLLCHNVPSRVCDYLRQTYRDLCDLTRYMARGMTPAPGKNAYLIIGHCNGQKVTYEGQLRDCPEEISQSYEYFSLEEPADHFFIRTTGSTVMDQIKKICPGDKCPSVVRLPPDRQTCLDLSNTNAI